MQSKILSKRPLLFAGIAVIASSLVLLIVIFFLGLPAMDSYTSQNLIGGKSIESATLPNQEQTSLPLRQAGLGLPIRLKIPKITINAAFVYVGLTSKGAMDVPKGPDDVAWFKLGPRPGEDGSAVIAGHFGWQNKMPAVFDNLHKLRKGDKLYVEDDKGTITTFVVRESRNYGPNDNAPDVYGSSDGKAHLNLVTCQGVWNKNLKSYSQRLVVFTDKE